MELLLEWLIELKEFLIIFEDLLVKLLDELLVLVKKHKKFKKVFVQIIVEEVELRARKPRVDLFLLGQDIWLANADQNSSCHPQMAISYQTISSAVVRLSISIWAVLSSRMRPTKTALPKKSAKSSRKRQNSINSVLHNFLKI